MTVIVDQSVSGGSITTQLDALAGLPISANKLAFYTSDTEADLIDFPSFIRGAISSGDDAESFRNAIGVGSVLDSDFQNSIISQIDFTTSEPGAPTLNDRYINTATGNSSVTAQSVTQNNIYEWNGTTWDEAVPKEGFFLTDEALSLLLIFNGSAWANAGTYLLHNQLSTLQGGTTNEFFHLTSTEHGFLSGQDQAVKTTNEPAFIGIDFSGQASTIELIDNNASGLDIKEGANSYLKFVTTDAAESLELSKPLNVGSNVDITLAGGGEVLGAPSVPSGPGAYVSKAFFDSQTVLGAKTKANVAAATTSSIADLSDVPTTGSFVVDGHTMLDNQRVDVKDDASPDGIIAVSDLYNGIYVYDATAGTLTRSSDLDNSPSGEIYNGVWTVVENGTVNIGLHLRIISTGTGTDGLHIIGTDSIVWDDSAVNFVAGDGMDLSGQTLSVDFNSSNLKITAGQINTIQDIGLSSDVVHGSTTVDNLGLHVKGTSGNFDLIISPGSTYTQDRTLKFTTGDADRFITVNGNVLLDDWFNQEVKDTSDVTHNSLSLSTPLAIANGGHGAITASGARNNLGVLLSSATGEIASITAKSTPIGADLALIEDSAAGNAKKSVTLAKLVETSVADQTWEPTIGDGSNNFTTTSQLGEYNVIGGRVEFDILIIWTSKGSASGPIVISLPIATTSTRLTIPIGFTSSITFTGMIFALKSGANSIQIAQNNNGTVSNLTDSAFASSGQIQLSGSFRV